MSTRITTNLVLRGPELNMDDISERLRLTPTDTWRTGEVLPGTTRTLKRSGWRYRLGPDETVSFDRQLHALQEIVTSRTTDLAQLSNEPGITVEVCFEAIIVGERPYLSLPSGLLRTLSDANAVVEVDFIDMSPE